MCGNGRGTKDPGRSRRRNAMAEVTTQAPRALNRRLGPGGDTEEKNKKMRHARERHAEDMIQMEKSETEERGMGERHAQERVLLSPFSVILAVFGRGEREGMLTYPPSLPVIDTDESGVGKRYTQR